MTSGKITLHEVLEVTNRIEDKLDKMDDRITCIEIWKANLMGKVSIVVAVVSIAFTAIWDFVRKKIEKL